MSESAPQARRVLLVAYGSGHVRMLIPVARALQDQGVAVQVLGLTTAAAVVRDAGLPLLQFKDFVQPGDEAALAYGERLLQQMGPVADADETRAYLGLSYADLVAERGEREAAEQYAQLGRQAFLPLNTLLRILQRVQPDAVVVTNSPRAERAAAVAARQLGIPCLCLVDLFAIDEVRWIGQPGYADRVCVLNSAVRDFLVAAGRRPADIVVTGNPAFDALCQPQTRADGQRLREQQGWSGKRVVLWPTQVEPPVHPWDGTPGDVSLPERALAQLQRWAMAHDDAVLCVRARAGETPPTLVDHPHVRLTGQDWPLAPLLHACDAVATLSSTVGLEGYLTGARVLQVTGSVFDHAMPLFRYGLADATTSVDGLADALSGLLHSAQRRPPVLGEPAAERVAREVRALLA